MTVNRWQLTNDLNLLTSSKLCIKLLRQLHNKLFHERCKKQAVSLHRDCVLVFVLDKCNEFYQQKKLNIYRNTKPKCLTSLLRNPMNKFIQRLCDTCMWRLFFLSASWTPVKWSKQFKMGENNNKTWHWPDRDMI